MLLCEFWDSVARWLSSICVGDPIVLGKKQALFGVDLGIFVCHVIIVCKEIIRHKDILELNHVKARMKIEKESEC